MKKYSIGILTGLMLGIGSVFLLGSSTIKPGGDRFEYISGSTVDLKIFDKKRGLVWFPSVINMGPKGIIYPEGTVNDWYWNFASVIDVPEEERDQYEGHDKRLDIENPQKFGQFEFMEACKAMGIVKDNG